MKKLLSLIITAVMILSCLPFAAHALTSVYDGREAESIEVDDISVYEFTGGYYPNNDYTRYVYRTVPDKIRVTFTDGTSETLRSSWFYNMFGAEVTVEDAQTDETPFGIGHHEVKVTVEDLSCTFDFEVVESPISSLVAGSVWRYETLDAETEYHHPGSSPYWDYSYTYYECRSNDVTAVLKDGTVVKCEHSVLDLDGESYYIYQFDDQNVGNEWGVGHHKAYLTVMGATAEYDVEIVSNPVDHFEFEDLYLREHFDGYYTGGTRFMYKYDPVCVAYMKDGSTVRSEGDFLNVCGRSFFIWPEDDQGSTEWELGEHTYSQTFGVCRVEGRAAVVPANIASVTITGGDEPVLSVTYNDGGRDDYIMKRLDCYGNTPDSIRGTLITDRWTFEITAYSDSYGYRLPTMTDNVRVVIGDYGSNTLESWNWPKIEYMRRLLPVTLKDMRRDFGFDGGAASSISADDAAAIAVNLLLSTDYRTDTGYDAKTQTRYGIFETDAAAAIIDYLFGEGTVDITEHSAYDPEDPGLIRIVETGQWWDGGDYVARVSADGYTVSYIPSEDVDVDYDRLDVIFSKDCRITDINFVKGAAALAGDVDGNGSVDMRDLLALRSGIAGVSVLTEEQAARADVNGDGSVNMKDVLALRRIVAGAQL